MKNNKATNPRRRAAGACWLFYWLRAGLRMPGRRALAITRKTYS